MAPAWEDLIARSRGLGSHLLGREALAGLGRAPDLGTLAGELRSFGYPAVSEIRRLETHAQVEALELAVRRGASNRLAILQRWSGPRVDTLAVLLEDEERRSLRRLIRGVVQGAAPATRLAGLLPTPGLPERALGELAQQKTVAAIGTLLAAWQHPYADPLLASAPSPSPDLAAIETAMHRRFARRATAGSRRGGSHLQSYVAELIDLDNGWSALVLAGSGARTVEETFLDGGRYLSYERFVSAAQAADLDGALEQLRRAFTRGPIGEVFSAESLPQEMASRRIALGRLEQLALTALIDAYDRLARLDPLSPASLIAFVLRLRAEVWDLRSLIWGQALAAPAELLISELVTPKPRSERRR